MLTQQKNNFMVNATFIESRNTTECNDVSCKSFVPSAKKLFEVKILFNIWNNGSNRYHNQHGYENPLQCKCFTKIVVSKFIKVSVFNENKHMGLNKCKNKRFCP